jgi:hypothetical protein
VEGQFDVQRAEGPDAQWAAGEPRESRVILMGWGLQQGALREGAQ